jgi:hypothetical protein
MPFLSVVADDFKRDEAVDQSNFGAMMAFGVF